MGYLFIFLAVLANGAKGYSSKRVSQSLKNTADSIIFSFARGFVCFAIALAVTLFNGWAAIASVTPLELIICIIGGAALAVFNCAWVLALRTDAYMLVSVCGSASFIVPCLVGLFVLGESFTVFKFLSFVLTVLSLLFLVKYNFKLNGRLGAKQIFLLALILVMQGINQVSQKLYTVYLPNKDVSCYTFYMLLSCFIAFLPALPFIAKKGNTDLTVVGKNAWHLAVMGIGLFLTTYFQTAAAKTIDSIILYPINNALSLIMGVIVAAVFFKEGMRRDSIIGIILVFFALLFSRF